MNKIVYFLVLSLWVSVASALDLKPDLTTTFRFSGLPLVHREGHYLVPLRITVKNAGRDIAGRFKINAEFNHISFAGTRVVYFSHISSPGRGVIGDEFYAWTNKALPVGQSIEFNAFITIPKTVPRGQDITVRVMADSCVGDEFEAAFCRIDELNEENNRTDLQTVRLP